MGKRLAEYLVQKLSEKGIKTEEIIAEDWGWDIPIPNQGFRLAICCGHQDGDDDEFLCFTDPSTPGLVKKFFKRDRCHSTAHPAYGGNAADFLFGSRNQRRGMDGVVIKLPLSRKSSLYDRCAVVILNPVKDLLLDPWQGPLLFR